MPTDWGEIPSISSLYGDEFAAAFAADVLGQTVVGIRVRRQTATGDGCLTDQAEWFGVSAHGRRLTQGSESVCAEVTLGNGKVLHLCRCWSGADWEICSFPGIIGDDAVITSKHLKITEGGPRLTLDFGDATEVSTLDPSPLVGCSITGYSSGASSDLLEVDGGGFLWIHCSPGYNGPGTFGAKVGQWIDRDLSTAQLASSDWEGEPDIEA